MDLSRIRGDRRFLTMKKWMTLLLCTLLLLSLAGCGGSSGKEEPAKEETKETETAAEPEKIETPETNDGMVERTVGNAFRFLVPEDWKQQTDGSYEVKTDEGPLYIYFFRFRVKGDGYAMPDGFSLDSDDFGEALTDYLNDMQLLTEGSLSLYNSDEKAYHTETGLSYRHIACDVLDSNGNKVDYMLFYLYEWNEEAYFSIVFEPAYDVVSVRDCIGTIHKTIERVD